MRCAAARGAPRRPPPPRRRRPRAVSRAAGFGGGESGEKKSEAALQASFAAWREAAGVRSEALEVRTLGPGGYRGTVAVRKVRRGDALVTLPRAAALHVLDGENRNTDDLVSDAAWALAADKTRLALRLAAEKRKGSRSGFFPYVAQLPAGFPGMPSGWPAGERDALLAGYEPLAAAAAAQAAEWAAAYDALRRADPSAAVSREELDWAQRAVESRVFSGRLGAADGSLEVGVRALAAGLAVVLAGGALGEALRPVGGVGLAALVAYELFGSPDGAGDDEEGGRMCYMMAPMIDAVNSLSRTRTPFEHDASTDTFTLRADEDAEAGEEVFISYGPLDNDTLLLRYGYVQPGNPYDRFDFGDALALLRRVHPPAQAVPAAERERELREKGLLAATRACVLRADGSLDDARAAQGLKLFLGGDERDAVVALCAAAEARDAELAAAPEGAGERGAVAKAFRAEKRRVLANALAKLRSDD